MKVQKLEVMSNTLIRKCQLHSDNNKDNTKYKNYHSSNHNHNNSSSNNNSHHASREIDKKAIWKWMRDTFNLISAIFNDMQIFLLLFKKKSKMKFRIESKFGTEYLRASYKTTKTIFFSLGAIQTISDTLGGGVLDSVTKCHKGEWEG